MDGEIAKDDGAQLERHLAACPACRAVADALASQDAELDRAFAPRRAAATMLAERVIARLETPPAQAELKPRTSTDRSWWANWGKPLLAAAAGFGLAILVIRSPKTPEHTVIGPAPHPVTTAFMVAKPVGQLALATGAVFVCPSDSDQWHPLESGGAVQAGMKERTGSKG